MIRSFIKFWLSNSRVRQYLKRCYDEVRQDVLASSNLETAIPEATPIQCRSSEIYTTRLNLLVPALSIKHVFGGISTALEFFCYLAEDFESVRIILTDQSEFRYEDNPDFKGWGIASLDDEDHHGRWIIPAGDRYGKTLPVSKEDRFVATAWWTAKVALFIQDWQCETFEFSEPPKYVYIIQDFEPGFYPWSSRYALAESTYSHTENFVAIFNTSFLKEFFDTEGYRFSCHYTFEPKLNQRLLELRPSALRQVRERRVLIYGRPGVARNAFEVIVMGLRRWVEQNPDSDWTFVSAGELHAPVDLGGGKTLVSLGKLSLDEYAMELGRCFAGISLMISPHPSYPPLEMAVFGIQVVTNRFKSRDLSVLDDNFHCLESTSPEDISITLNKLAQNFEKNHYTYQFNSGSPFYEFLGRQSTFNCMREPILGHVFKNMQSLSS